MSNDSEHAPHEAQALATQHLERKVRESLGAASTCWDEGGVFQAERALAIAEDLVAYIRASQGENAERLSEFLVQPPVWNEGKDWSGRAISVEDVGVSADEAAANVEANTSGWSAPSVPAAIVQWLADREHDRTLDLDASGLTDDVVARMVEDLNLERRRAPEAPHAVKADVVYHVTNVTSTNAVTDALDAVLDAWEDAGSHPRNHRKAKRELARTWPTLAKAIQVLREARRG